MIVTSPKDQRDSTIAHEATVGCCEIVYDARGKRVRLSLKERPRRQTDFVLGQIRKFKKIAKKENTTHFFLGEGTNFLFAEPLALLSVSSCSGNGP